MKPLYTLLIFSLLTSCSVKKQVAKSESLTKVETEVTKTEVETISTITSVDTDTYEVEVVAKDSLQPITINLNGTTQTFSGASKVVLRKKKEALKQEETKSAESNEKRTEEVTEEKEVMAKEVKRSNHLWILPIIISAVVLFVVRRYAKNALGI